MSERACGDCQACCVVLGVRGELRSEEFVKQPHHTCPHQARSRGGGCAVYDERPGTCRSYRCSWLGGLGKARHRPDRLGVVLDQPAPPREVLAAAGGATSTPEREAARAALQAAAGRIVAREVRPGAFHAPRAKALLESLKRSGFRVELVPWRGRKLPTGVPL